MNKCKAVDLDRVNCYKPAKADLFIGGLLSEFEGGMNERFGRMLTDNAMWDFALDLAFHEDPRVAFRASWALEWAYFNDRVAFRPYLGHFVDNFLRASNPSVHRHYTKMLWDMLHRGVLELDDAQAGQVAEKAFDLLIDPKTRVAVMVWCMEILYDLSPRLDWIEEPLRDTVRRIMENEPSQGIANRGSKLLKRMDKRMGRSGWGA